MRKNRWRDLRRIKIRLIDIILAVLVMLVFFFAKAYGSNETKAISTEAEAAQREQIIKHETKYPIAGATLAIYENAMLVETDGDTGEAVKTYTTGDLGDWIEHTEEEQETEIKTDEEEKAEGLYIDEIPLSETVQKHFREFSKQYGCPLAFAIATADVETDFTMEAVGEAGEKGYMQIYPGETGIYFEAIEEKTGLDPATKEGNIAAGCYLLGKYLNEYSGDYERASMAYNMGVQTAEGLWQQGVYSSEYSRKVYAAYQKWDAVIKDAGIE